MFTISKEFSFSASHTLAELPEGHPCLRLHGHNYVVELVLAAEELDPSGFVVDYLDLKCVGAAIDDRLDHRHLNDVMPGPTSAEGIARYIFDMAREVLPGPAASRLVAVRVGETPKTCAEFRPRPS